MNEWFQITKVGAPETNQQTNVTNQPGQGCMKFHVLLIVIANARVFISCTVEPTVLTIYLPSDNSFSLLDLVNYKIASGHNVSNVTQINCYC